MKDAVKQHGQRKPSDKHPDPLLEKMRLLQPNGGQVLYEQVHRKDTGSAKTKARYHVYRVVSLINSAMRERASDHKRSTERVDTSNASAVSAVVKPAK